MRLARLPSLVDPLPAWPPLLATEGAGGRSERHAHHAMHLLLARTGSIAIAVGDEPAKTAAGVLTAPDVPHAIDARGTDVLLVFLDPESTVGATLRTAFAGTHRLVSHAERDSLVRDADPMAIMGEGGTRFTERLANTLGASVAPRTPMHPRVRRLLRHLATLPAGSDVSLEACAEIAGLSAGRLMHAFTESVGIPLRPYLAWLRLQRAAAGIVRGDPLAQVAIDAGFSDAAHLTRSVRRAFGMTPSMLRPSKR